eukprot:2811-Heterococcus_DN1.PRE.2
MSLAVCSAYTAAAAAAAAAAAVTACQYLCCATCTQCVHCMHQDDCAQSVSVARVPRCSQIAVVQLHINIPLQRLRTVCNIHVAAAQHCTSGMRVLPFTASHVMITVNTAARSTQGVNSHTVHKCTSSGIRAVFAQDREGKQLQDVAVKAVLNNGNQRYLTVVVPPIGSGPGLVVLKRGVDVQRTSASACVFSTFKPESDVLPVVYTTDREEQRVVICNEAGVGTQLSTASSSTTACRLQWLAAPAAHQYEN